MYYFLKNFYKKEQFPKNTGISESIAHYDETDKWRTFMIPIE